MQRGTHVGQFEVVELIGRGGMGEVWKARDTRLGRYVALKILSPELAGDTERIALEREAMLLAGLSHPNIATIHGIERTSTRCDRARCRLGRALARDGAMERFLPSPGPRRLRVLLSDIDRAGGDSSSI